MAKSEEQKPCILIVDDVVDNIIMLDGLLRDQYQIKAASSGEKALKIAAAVPGPDLIILDIMMPEMDGFDVCRRLKADPALADIPVIFLTARNFVEDETAGLALGAVDFIAKPVNPPIVLARVRTHLLLKRARDVLWQRNELLENNLRAAAKIQENLLPKEDMNVDRLRFSWRFRPSEAVGGDLLNFFPLGQEHVGAYILDVAGHGLPAAMVTFAIAQAMQPLSGLLAVPYASPPAITRPGAVLRRLSEQFPFDRFQSCFTIAYLVIDLKSGKVVSSTAGHPFPVILRRNGGLVPLDKGGSLIGIGESGFAESEETLFPGDKLFLYTDGVTELHDPERAMFGLERLEQLLQRTAGDPVEAISDGILTSLTEFAGTEKPDDDITILGMEYR